MFLPLAPNALPLTNEDFDMRISFFSIILLLQRIFFVIPVETGIQHVYGFQNPNWIPAGVYPVPRYRAGMTDGAVALFVGTVSFFFKKVAVIFLTEASAWLKVT